MGAGNLFRAGWTHGFSVLKRIGRLSVDEMIFTSNPSKADQVNKRFDGDDGLASGIT